MANIFWLEKENKEIEDILEEYSYILLQSLAESLSSRFYARSTGNEIIFNLTLKKNKQYYITGYTFTIDIISKKKDQLASFFSTSIYLAIFYKLSTLYLSFYDDVYRLIDTSHPLSLFCDAKGIKIQSLVEDSFAQIYSKILESPTLSHLKKREAQIDL